MSEGRRCAEHGLAFGPEGQCVLCRRTYAAPAPAAPIGPFAYVAAAVGICCLAIGAGMMYRAISRGQPGEFAAADPAGISRSSEVKSVVDSRPGEPAASQVAITMYTTKWCGACKAARGYLNAKGYAYVEHDVEKDESARIAHHKLNPKGSVPTIDVGGRVFIGFSAAQLENAIKSR